MTTLERLALCDALADEAEALARSAERMASELRGLLDDMSHAIGSVRDVRQLKLEEVA